MTKPSTPEPIAPFPWMPIYVEELAGLALRFECESLGAILRLRAYSWHSSPRATVPDDDAKLSAISGLGPRWGDLGDAIRELYTPFQGRLLDTILRKRYDEQLAKHLSAVQRGRKGGRPPKAGPKAEGEPQVKPSFPSALFPLSSSFSSSKELRGLEQNKLSETSAFEDADNPDVLQLAARAEEERWCAEHPDMAAAVEAEVRAQLGMAGSDEPLDWQRHALVDQRARAIRRRMSRDPSPYREDAQ